MCFPNGLAFSRSNFRVERLLDRQGRPESVLQRVDFPVLILWLRAASCILFPWLLEFSLYLIDIINYIRNLLSIQIDSGVIKEKIQIAHEIL